MGMRASGADGITSGRQPERARPPTGLSDWWERGTGGVVATVYASLLILGVLQVFFRYVIGFSLSWSEEAARFLFVYLVFMATAIGIRRGTHIGVDLIVQSFPTRLRLAVTLLCSFLVLGFSLLLAYLGVRISAMTMAQVSAALEIPMGTIYAALAIGGALMSVEAAVRLRRSLYETRGGEGQSATPATPFE
jgi:TRAP-type C4-dicarboxylate transport system permease small subunit